MLDRFAETGTKRDNKFQIAEDLSIALFARDESTDIGAAFKELEDTLPRDLTAQSRKELQRQLVEQICEAAK